MTTAVYPGMFDPLTNGHVDVIQRASQLFNRVIVAVAVNPNKPAFFSAEQRVTLLKQVVAPFKNVTVECVSGLIVEFVEKHQGKVIVRGIRTSTDFDYELQMAAMNRQLKPQIETVFLVPSEKYSFVSSSLVRDIASLGGDISEFVPKEVAIEISQRRVIPAKAGI